VGPGWEGRLPVGLVLLAGDKDGWPAALNDAGSAGGSVAWSRIVRREQ